MEVRVEAVGRGGEEVRVEIGRKRNGVLRGVGKGKGGVWQMVGRVYAEEL